jgi:membrane peptidoglycan carboxypeptidase
VSYSRSRISSVNCLRWCVTGAISLAVAGIVALSILWVATPGAYDAMTIAREQAAQRGQHHLGVQPPPRFVQALTATEDHRFYSLVDVGIDPFALIKIFTAELRGNRHDQGGSTIDQQLAKMLYTPGQSGQFAVDLLQVMMAIKLHFLYSPAQILRMYAGLAYFGSGYYGLDAASFGYFGKSPPDLTWAQAAMLAGVVNAPSRDDPRTHPANASARLAHVFNRLVAVGALTKRQADMEKARPLDVIHQVQ